MSTTAMSMISHSCDKDVSVILGTCMCTGLSSGEGCADSSITCVNLILNLKKTPKPSNFKLYRISELLR